MKKKLILLLPISFFLCSCSLADLNIFGWKPFASKENKQNEQQNIDDVTPDDQGKHATKITLTPGAPFTLKIGESRDLSISFDQTPSDKNEQIFTWELTGDAVEYTVNETNTRKAKVVGVKVGSSELKVTNTYNRQLSKSFSISVVDFNENNDYIWQYDSSVDLAKFSSKDGRAYLSGMEWDFTREKGAKAHTLNGGVAFGTTGNMTQGIDPNPETRLEFNAHNSRVVKSITVEGSSTNAQANMTIKVGDKTYLETKLDEDDNKVLTKYTSSVDEYVAGDISILIETPEYDPSKSDDFSYRKPGNCTIKSILVSFDEAPEFATSKTYDFKAMYNDENDETFASLNSSSTKAINITDDTFDINLEKVSKPEGKDTDKITGVALSNGYIDIKCLKENEVISKVEFKIDYGTATSKNYYSVHTSRFGGIPYSNSEIVNLKDTDIVKSYIFPDNINAIRLVNRNSYNVGLDYLKVYTRAGKQATIKFVLAPETFVPTKTSYNDGDLFNPEGLPSCVVNFNESDIRNDYLAPSAFEWYDGTTYETDPATASKTLKGGTTSVYGVFKEEFVVKVENIEVLTKVINVTKLLDPSEITATGKYYITCPSAKLILKGSVSNSNTLTKNGAYKDENLEFTDNMVFGGTLENEYMTIAPTGDGKFAISNRNSTPGYIGIKADGSGSCTNTVEIKEFTLTINAETGIITASLPYTKNDEEVFKYLGCNESNGNFGMYNPDKANVVIYKVV